MRWERSSPIDDTVVLDADRPGQPGPHHVESGNAPVQGADGPRPPGDTADDRAADPGQGGAAGDPSAGATDAPPGSPNATRRARRGASGRPPSTDTDGLGLADLLAGALAAYRDM